MAENLDLSELERIAREATPGPWLYRPHELDDWGTVRDGDGRYTVARGFNGGGDERTLDDHRRNGTDPYGPNSVFIATFNPERVLAMLAEISRLETAVLDAAMSDRVDEAGSPLTWQEAAEAAEARALSLEEGLRAFARVGRERASPNCKAVWRFERETVTDDDFRRAADLLARKEESASRGLADNLCAAPPSGAVTERGED